MAAEKVEARVDEKAVGARAAEVEEAAADEEKAVGARAFCFLVIWAGGFKRGAALFPGRLPPSKSASLPPRRRVTAALSLTSVTAAGSSTS
jgi:hypothetical protein